MTPEGIVVAAVERYFLQPKFRKFSIKKEHAIQMGSDNRRADVVLVDNEGNLAAIAECKQIGVEGHGPDQLKSYLCATDTPFGIFANSTEPDDWEFYENLRQNRFRGITRSEFEKQVSKSESNLRQSNQKSAHYSSVTPFVNKGESMKIRPTLYVGLGTTGTEILNHLRKLRHKEYGSTEYPIFRYVSIETDTSTDGIVPEIDGNVHYIAYDEQDIPRVKSTVFRPESGANKVIHTTIPTTEPIRDAINPTHPSYSEHLDAWLDPKILDVDATTRAGGAGNLRMVGRLSLWENWDKQSRVQQNLREAYDAIWEVSNREKAAKSLEGHFGPGITVDEKNRNVFIVGTLCGGTCSGMLLDIAYYFRHIGNENTKIYGIFTMYDEALALEAPRIQLANCYASLVELDYYKRNATEYRVTLPNGPAIHINKSPFDVATFLSATNMAGERFINQNGQFVQRDLDRTVASDLFLRSLGVDAIIDSDLVNSPGFDSRFEDAREGNQFVQYMFGSGLEKVWLPKNQTVKAAATMFIRELSSKWKGSHSADVSDPNMLFGKTLEDIKASTSLESKLLNNESATLNSPRDAVDCLEALVAGGRYFKRVKENSDSCLKQVIATLHSYSSTMLNKVNELIQAELEKPNYPDNLISHDNIGKRAEEAEKLAQKRTGGFFGINRQTELDIQKFRHEISSTQFQLRDQLSNYFVKQVLNDLLNEIPKLIEGGNNQRGTVETKLTEAINWFKVNETIPDEIVSAASRLIQEYPGGLSTQASVDELVNILHLSSPNCFHWHIANKLRGAFNSIADDLIPEFSQDAVRRSSPYEEFTHSYMRNYRLRLERPGGETRLFRFLLASQQPENSSNLKLESQSRDEEFPIRHLRALYQMEAGFTADDLRVASRLKEEYNFYQQKYSYPIHIEKDSSKFNPDTIRATIETSNRVKEVQKDWRALRQLLPFIRKDDANRFQYVSFNGSGSTNGAGPLPIGVLVIKVVGEAGFRKTFPDNEQGWEKLVADSVACNNFILETRSEFGNMSDEGTPLSHYIETLLDTDNHQDGEQFYEEYIALLQKHPESS